MENVQYITLDVMDNKTFDYIYTKQYDVGRTVIFTITKDGEPMNLSGLSAIFSLSKPDGNIILRSTTDDEITINVDNTITLILTDQITVLSGKLPYQISLLDGSRVVSTITGYIFCEKAAIQRDGLESISDGSLLEDLAIVAEAIKDGTIHSGDIVSVSAIQQSGTKIAEVTVNDVQTDLYAPSVDVEDVYVNGSSVLDNNNIAQIKTHKTLSLGQYNQLSTAEKNNGTIYFVESSNANYTYVESQDGTCVVRIDNTTHETLWFWRGYNFTSGDMPIPSELRSYAPNSSTPIFTSNYPGGRSIQDGWVGFYNNQMRCWIQDLSLTGGGIQYGVLDVNGVNQQINPYTDPYDVGGNFEIYYMGHKYSENEIGINDLTDVTITSPSNGQILKYDVTTQKWINADETGEVTQAPMTGSIYPLLLGSVNSGSDSGITYYDDGLTWNGYYARLTIPHSSTAYDPNIVLDGVSESSITLNGLIPGTLNTGYILITNDDIRCHSGYWDNGNVSLKNAIGALVTNKIERPSQPTDGQILAYDILSNDWVAANPITYSDFAGSTHGLVPAATQSDTGKFLKADGTWATPSGGGSSTLSGLSDVDAPQPADGDILIYDDSLNKWVSSTATACDLTNGYIEIYQDVVLQDGYWDANTDEPQYTSLLGAVAALFDAVESGGGGGGGGGTATALDTGYVASDGDENIGVILKNGSDIIIDDSYWNPDGDTPFTHLRDFAYWVDGAIRDLQGGGGGGGASSLDDLEDAIENGYLTFSYGGININGGAGATNIDYSYDDISFNSGGHWLDDGTTTYDSVKDSFDRIQTEIDDINTELTNMSSSITTTSISLGRDVTNTGYYWDGTHDSLLEAIRSLTQRVAALEAIVNP